MSICTYTCMYVCIVCMRVSAHTSSLFAISRSSSGQNKESELLIAATVLQAASWLIHM